MKRFTRFWNPFLETLNTARFPLNIKPFTQNTSRFIQNAKRLTRNANQFRGNDSRTKVTCILEAVVFSGSIIIVENGCIGYF